MAKVKKKLHLRDSSHTMLDRVNSPSGYQDISSPAAPSNVDVTSLTLDHVDSLLDKVASKPLPRQPKGAQSAKRLVVRGRPRKRVNSMPAHDFSNQVKDNHNLATAVSAPKKRKEVPKGSESPSVDELCSPDGKLLVSKDHPCQPEGGLPTSLKTCDDMNLSVNSPTCDHRTVPDGSGSPSERLRANQKSGEPSPTVDDLGTSFNFDVQTTALPNHSTTTTTLATVKRKPSRSTKRKKSAEPLLASPRSPTPPLSQGTLNQDSDTNDRKGPAESKVPLSPKTGCVVQRAQSVNRQKSRRGRGPGVNSAARRSQTNYNTSPTINSVASSDGRTIDPAQVGDNQENVVLSQPNASRAGRKITGKGPGRRRKKLDLGSADTLSVGNSASVAASEPVETPPDWSPPTDPVPIPLSPGPSSASSPPPNTKETCDNSLSQNPNTSDISCYCCETCQFETSDMSVISEHKIMHSAQRHRLQEAPEDGLCTTSEGSLGTERPLDPESGSDVDDDEELPEAFPEGDTNPYEKVSKGDIMWVQTKKYPFWPAVVKNIYHVKKKLSKVTIVFIGVFHKGIKGLNGKPRGLTMAYNKHKIIPFGQSHTDHEQLKADGMASKLSEFFEDCLNRVEDYLYKKATGETNLGTLEYFKEEMALDELEEVEMTPNLLESLYAPPEEETHIEKHDQSDSGEESDVIHSSFDSPKMSKALVKKLQKSRDAGQKIIDIISQPFTKELMWKIYRGEKDSSRQHQYLDPSLSPMERNALKMAGYGRITDDAQRDAIMDVLVRYWRDMLPKKKMVDIDYITSVWVPEAIIFAMSKSLRCGYKRAEMKFVQGPRFTKEELKRFEREIMANKDSIDKEARDRYDRKIDRNVRKLQSLEANFRGMEELQSSNPFSFGPHSNFIT